MFKHAYWYLNPWVNTDVIAILRHDLRPAERGLFREGGEAIWSFPKNYPEQIGAILAK